MHFSLFFLVSRFTPFLSSFHGNNGNLSSLRFGKHRQIIDRPEPLLSGKENTQQQKKALNKYKKHNVSPPFNISVFMQQKIKIYHIKCMHSSFTFKPTDSFLPRMCAHRAHAIATSSSSSPPERP